MKFIWGHPAQKLLVTCEELLVCPGFARKGFGSGDATGVASVRSCLKQLLCPIESMTVSSKMEPPLAKVNTISGGGGTSVITYLRRGKKICTVAARREEKKYVRETTWQTPRSVNKEGEEMLQALEQ